MRNVLSLCSITNNTNGVRSAVSVLLEGDPDNSWFDELIWHNQTTSGDIEKLSESILYAPHLQAVRDLRHHKQILIDQHLVLDYLDPVQRALKRPILSSAMIITPEKMLHAITKNPRDVLLDIKPLDSFNTSLPPEGILVQFEDEGVPYMGWQIRSNLPTLFDCELHDLLYGEPTVVTTAATMEASSWFTGFWGNSTPKIEPEIAAPPLSVIVVPNPMPPPVVSQRQIFSDTLNDGGNGPEMVILPSGAFQMGSNESDDEEKPVHKVRIGYQLAVGRYPITFDDYSRFCQALQLELPADNGWGRGRRPVINIDWYEANEYCEWLTLQSGRNYRLLSEAEWEYACRAGTQTHFFFGDSDNQLIHYAWFKGNAEAKTQPVGQKLPNAWGLHDMLGNVWEWCSDYWHDNYRGAPNDGSSWNSHANSDRCLLRGGSWNNNPLYCRPAYRIGGIPGDLSDDYGLGFRVCCLPPISA